MCDDNNDNRNSNHILGDYSPGNKKVLILFWPLRGDCNSNLTSIMELFTRLNSLNQPSFTQSPACVWLPPLPWLRGACKGERCVSVITPIVIVTRKPLRGIAKISLVFQSKYLHEFAEASDNDQRLLLWVEHEDFVNSRDTQRLPLISCVLVKVASHNEQLYPHWDIKRLSDIFHLFKLYSPAIENAAFVFETAQRSRILSERLTADRKRPTKRTSIIFGCLKCFIFFLRCFARNFKSKLFIHVRRS